jgi:hypothetical protein
MHQFALALFTFCSTTALTSYSNPIIMHSFALALFTFCSTTALTSYSNPIIMHPFALATLALCLLIARTPHSRYMVNATIEISIAAAAMAASSGSSSIPVYPFAWECYHNGTTRLSHTDLEIDVVAPYNAGADGLVVWGYTGGNDGISCQGGSQMTNYFDYVKTETGPMIKVRGGLDG